MKKIGIFFMLTCLLTAAIVVETQAAAYTPALPSESQAIWPEKYEDGTYNLLVNSGFETVAEDGAPTGWTVSHDIEAEGASFITAAGDAYAGENFAVISGKTGGRIYLSQVLTSFLTGETYAFSSYMRHISGEGQLRLNIICQKPSGNTYTNIDNFRYPIEADTSWTKVAYSFTVPAETTRILFHIRVDGEAELHVDSTALVGQVQSHVAKGTEFREMLQKEETARAQMERDYTGDWNKSSVTNDMPLNGDLEDNDGSTFSDWGYSSAFSPYLKVAENASHDGSDAMEIAVPKGNGLKNPYYYQIVKLVGGAEYEVSFWYKNEGGGNAAIKLEYYTDRTLPGAEGYGGKHIKGTSADGWQYTAETVTVPANATEATVLARLLQSTETVDAKCYIDDISIRMTRPPAPLQFSTSAVFFYSDETEGTLSTSVNLTYFPAFANAKVDFAILDGEKILWEKLGIISEEGKTSEVFSLLVLKETKKKEYPFIARATLYDADGNVAEIKTQQIYMYDRPAFLGQDGIYLKNGTEPFYPLFAYKVNPEQYEKVKEAGINLVQMGAFSEADQAVAALDAAERAGIMGFIALYDDMQPAGSDANIETSISILSDPRIQKHTALFGYGVMDEVFLKLHNPQLDMENSYRLIRSLDKNRPIMAMEAVGNYYGETGKYVDILCIDPYAAAETRYVYTATARARKAVNYKKPVYALLETYYTTHGRWPAPEDGRNNNWQALLAGANAVGYFNIREADENADGAKLPIWEARDDGALWEALRAFAEKEKQIAYDHFVLDKTPVFCRYIGSEYGYSAWVDGQEIYLLVLGVQENQEKEVSIPLCSLAGDIQIGAYSAECIAGSDDTIWGSGSLSLTLHGIEALLYKITPEEKTDFQSLHAAAFEDMTDAPWAWQQVARLHGLGIVKGKTAWEFAPVEAITEAEFIEALSKVVNYSFDETADAEITAEEALCFAEKAFAASDVFAGAEAEKALCARYAAADLAVSLHRALFRGESTLSETLTRGEAAVLLDRAVYLTENPEAIRAYFGFSAKDAARLCRGLINAENIGETVGTVGYCVDGDYIFLQNKGTAVERVFVPKAGQYAKILMGVENSAVTLRESGTEIIVQPDSLCVLRVTDTPLAGLYIGNIAEAVPRENVTYTVQGRVAVYGNAGGVRELPNLHMEGDSVQIENGTLVRTFRWNENLQPTE